jgi:hypothetical protein
MECIDCRLRFERDYACRLSDHVDPRGVPGRGGATDKIDVGVAKNVNADEVIECFIGSVGKHVASSHEAPQRLNHLYVQQVRGMQVIAIAKEPSLDPRTERCLQEELRHG